MKAFIVEDSRLARLELTNLLSKCQGIEVVGQSGDPIQAIELINELQPDVLFLDIQMPGLNGFELLDKLNCELAVIFTTAYDQYAIKSFDYDTVDYLLKPIESERLQIALTKLKIRQVQQETIQPLTSDSSIFIKDGEQCHITQLTTISLFESCGNYTHVYFDGKKPLIHKSLNQLEQRLPIQHFFRANRQHIVNIKFISQLEPWINGGLKLTMLDQQEIEVSRRLSARFKNLMSL
jgi:two-component system, LytTR family, response regulator